MSKIIQDACEAEERYSMDDLETHATKWRKVNADLLQDIKKLREHMRGTGMTDTEKLREFVLACSSNRLYFKITAAGDDAGGEFIVVQLMSRDEVVDIGTAGQEVKLRYIPQIKIEHGHLETVIQRVVMVVWPSGPEDEDEGRAPSLATVPGDLLRLFGA